MAQPVITILGGGAYAPRLCEELARVVPLPDVELRLAARRLDRLAILGNRAATRVSAHRPDWSVLAARSLEVALEGASVVVLLIRVGGLKARVWDESFPRRFGLVGDEGLGPGGIANAWRTLPELGRIAQHIRRIAPAARLINLMAPLGMTTRLLLEHGLDTIGACELPLITLEAWLEAARSTGARPTFRYGGLNHLGWFMDVSADGKDVLRLVTDGPISPVAPLDLPTLERYGAAPLRHFYEIFDREAGRRLGVDRKPGRAAELVELSERLIQEFSREPGADVPTEKRRATPWLERAVAPMAAALLGGPPYVGFANVRRGDLIPELPPDLVVELSAKVTSQGVCPRRPGPLSKEVAGFLQTVGESEALTFLAAYRQDPDLLVAAIQSLPLPIPDGSVLELAALAREEVPQ